MEGKEVAIAGRLMSKRGMGKVMFCDLQDAAGRIQLYLKFDEMEEAEFEACRKLDIGDIVGDEERNKFTELLKAGFIDTYRTLYPDTIAYSWWSYRFQAREKNIGWRIDYFVASERLKDKVKDALIYSEILGSDHCPVGLEIEL